MRWKVPKGEQDWRREFRVTRFTGWGRQGFQNAAWKERFLSAVGKSPGHRGNKGKWHQEATVLVILNLKFSYWTHETVSISLTHIQFVSLPQFISLSWVIFQWSGRGWVKTGQILAIYTSYVKTDTKNPKLRQQWTESKKDQISATSFYFCLLIPPDSSILQQSKYLLCPTHHSWHWD